MSLASLLVARTTSTRSTASSLVKIKLPFMTAIFSTVSFFLPCLTETFPAAWVTTAIELTAVFSVTPPITTALNVSDVRRPSSCSTKPCATRKISPRPPAETIERSMLAPPLRGFASGSSVVRKMSLRSVIPCVSTLFAVMLPNAVTEMEPSVAVRLARVISPVLVNAMLPASVIVMFAI